MKLLVNLISIHPLITTIFISLGTSVVSRIKITRLQNALFKNKSCNKKRQLWHSCSFFNFCSNKKNVIFSMLTKFSNANRYVSIYRYMYTTSQDQWKYKSSFFRTNWQHEHYAFVHDKLLSEEAIWMNSNSTIAKSDKFQYNIASDTGMQRQNN